MLILPVQIFRQYLNTKWNKLMFLRMVVVDLWTPMAETYIG